MSKFLDAKLQALSAYVPGEQPRDKKYIKLNTNESPYPAGESAKKVISPATIADLRLYSDPTCKALKQKLAQIYNANPDQIFVGNGSDEILNFLFMAYSFKGVAFADLTYGFYSVFADLYGADTKIIPLKDDFSLDVDAFCGLNRLVVIANPNAPTGKTISLDEVEKIVVSNPDGVVVIDEAYVDFGGESCAPLTKKYNNLVCVQTFSKSRSLAGARLGFSISQNEICADLEKIKYSTNPYNVNALTQAVGVAVLDENDYYMSNAQKIVATRQWSTDELRALGFYVLDSKANFILAKCDGVDGEYLYKTLKDEGVLVRYFSTERIKDYVRITIGSDQDMQILVDKIKEILGEIK